LIERLKVSGVVILTISPGSAADSAGLKGATMTPEGNIVANDIIVAVEQKPVDSVEKLLARIDGYKVGDTIQLTVLRKGEEIVVPVTLQPGE
jgi:S1-C subfamily serine protease